MGVRSWPLQLVLRCLKQQRGPMVLHQKTGDLSDEDRNGRPAG